MKFVNWERTLTLAWPIILPFGDINNWICESIHVV